MTTALESIISGSDRRIEAVLFDWGGTLANYLGDIPFECIHRAASEVAPHGLSGLLADAIAQRVQESWSSGPFVPDTISTLTAQAISTLGEPSQCTGLQARFVERYLTILADFVRHNCSAREVLAALNQQGLHTAMLCNTIWPKAWHDAVLARDGLRALLPVRVYSSETFIRKPNPRAFRAVTDRLRLDARACVFVGDRGDEDIDGAASIGMYTIWVNNDYSRPIEFKPDGIVSSISELIGG